MLSTYRKCCVDKFQQNSDRLSKAILESWQIPYLGDSVVRFNAHGELINEIHAVNCLKIAYYNPDATFALWTKRTDFLKEAYSWAKRNISDYQKDNITFVRSSVRLNDVDRKLPLIDHVFTVFEKDLAHIININCHGKKCIECMLCYGKEKPIFINEVLK
jgi:hypothetical protein